MTGSNYPDDIRSYDNDPRSPFYDDKGEEAWCEARYTELLSDVHNLELDGDELLNVIYNNYDDKIKLTTAIIKYVESIASDQADDECENRDE